MIEPTGWRTYAPDDPHGSTVRRARPVHPRLRARVVATPGAEGEGHPLAVRAVLGTLLSAAEPPDRHARGASVRPDARQAAPAAARGSPEAAVRTEPRTGAVDAEEDWLADMSQEPEGASTFPWRPQR